MLQMDSFDLFAVAKPKEASPNSEGIVSSRLNQTEINKCSDQDIVCFGCYFMAWGKRLRTICCNPKHPGPIGKSAFCATASGNPTRYVPFDQGPHERICHEEMNRQNLT